MDDLDHNTREVADCYCITETLAMVSTRNQERENIAPMTSIQSCRILRAHRDVAIPKQRGRQRDTYLNLIETEECELQFLAPTRKALEEVDLASKPVEGSEWELLESDGPIHPLAVVVMKCRLVEDNPLPEGGFARLLTLRVESNCPLIPTA